MLMISLDKFATLQSKFFGFPTVDGKLKTSVAIAKYFVLYCIELRGTSWCSLDSSCKNKNKEVEQEEEEKRGLELL